MVVVVVRLSDMTEQPVGKIRSSAAAGGIEIVDNSLDPVVEHHHGEIR
jgi:hypothetical protein